MAVRISKPEIDLRSKLSELERPIGLKGGELLRAETAQEARELIGSGRKNILINGSMQIYQRASSASTGTGSSGTYRVHDRWFIRNANMGNFTISNGSDLSSGFSSNYIRWECTAADASPASDDFLYMHQAIEGYNVQQLKKGTPNAQYSTLSFWVKSSEVGIFTIQIYDGTNGRSCVKRYTIDSKDTWEYKTLTIPPDSIGTIINDNGARYFVTFWLGSGTNRTTGTNQLDKWASTVTSSEASGQTGNIASSVGSYIQFTQVQYEVGKVATEFDHRPYAEELALCQRYFCSSFSSNVTPQAGTQGTQEGEHQIHLVASGDPQIVVYFPVEMRAQPTMTLYNVRSGGAAGQWSTANSDGANARYYGQTRRKAIIDNTDNSLSATYWRIAWSASAEL